MEQPGYEKRGYLHEDFHLFHLCDAMREPVDWHYHTFHKLCVYLGGDAIRYGIEGRSYALEPGDLILVPQGCVHRPEVEPGAAYERMLLYLSPEFLRRSSTEEAPLETCFLQAAEDFRFVVRTGARNASLLEPLRALEREKQSPGFGQQMLERALLYQLLIALTRGMQEQALLKKAATLDIRMICPLHGPVWRKNIGWFIDKYVHWATYKPEQQAVVIAYASVYGGTENAANILACRLREQGVQVEMFDTSVTPASYILAAAFRFSHVVLAAPTYNGGVFVTMENLLHDLTAHGLKGRRAAYIENGSWAPTSARGMQKLLEPLNWETAADTVTLRSALRQGQQEDLERMAMQLAESVKA